MNKRVDAGRHILPLHRVGEFPNGAFVHGVFQVKALHFSGGGEVCRGLRVLFVVRRGYRPD